jgi:hypothetical protein
MKALRSMACVMRAAHAHVVEGLLAVVDRQDALARGAADLHREALVALELLERLQRAEARHAVDVAGQQRGHLRRRVVDEAEGHARSFTARRCGGRPTCSA